MLQPTPLSSKKCSLCQKYKPLSAYLTSQKDNKKFYGSVCHSCLGIDGRFLNLHSLRKKIQQLFGKISANGLFKKDDDDGSDGDGGWDSEDRGKSREHRFNLDASELGAEITQHNKLVGEKKEEESKAQKKGEKKEKSKKEKILKKQADELDEKNEQEKATEHEKAIQKIKNQEKKKTAKASREKLFSSYLQKSSNAQHDHKQNKSTTNQAKHTASSEATKTPRTKKEAHNTNSTNEQNNHNTHETTTHENAKTSNEKIEQHNQQKNATAFYKQNPSVADQFADLSNVTIRNKVPTSVSAGTVRLFQQTNANKGSTSVMTQQAEKQEGKEATAKAEAEELKSAIQLSMKNWK